MWPLVNNIILNPHCVPSSSRSFNSFNAYNALLGIQKAENESLPALTARVEKAMQEIKQTRPKAFTIDDLDSDLMCMALTRSLPSQYSNFISSLILLPQFDFPTLKKAFSLQEENDKAQEHQHTIAAAAQLATASSKPSKSSKAPSTRPKCDFCGKLGHLREKCFKLEKKTLQDRLGVLERLTGSPATANSSTDSKSSFNLSSSTEQAGQVQDSAREFAGNASTILSSPSPVSSHSIRWCADTGASSHMTPNREWFDEYTPYVVPVRVADGTVVQSAGIGSVHFIPTLSGRSVQEVVFHKVLHVPQLCNSLLSVLYLTAKQGFSVSIDAYTMSFKHNGSLLFTASMQGNLAYLDGTTLRNTVTNALTSSTSSSSSSLLPLSLELWHRRFSHINYPDLRRMIDKQLVSGIKLDSNASPDPVCEPCIAGKQVRIVNKTATRSSTPLAIVHCDLHGPMPVATQEGYRYF